MSHKKLVVHVGLHKTGTTTLQNAFFRAYHNYVGTAPGAREQPAALLSLYDTPSAKRGPGLTRWCDDNFAQRDTVIVSHEALTGWSPHQVEPLRRTTQARTRPHPLLEFVDDLSHALGDDAVIQVIVSLRNQPDFLGSLYAQMWRHSRVVSQTDFEQRLQRIIDSADSALDWSLLVAELHAALGPENVLATIFEHGLEHNIERMREFLGDQPTSPMRTKLPQANSRRAGSGQWDITGQRRTIADLAPARAAAQVLGPNWQRTRKAGKKAVLWLNRKVPHLLSPALPDRSIHLPEPLRQHIQDVYGPSNRELERLLGVDLGQDGYYR